MSDSTPILIDVVGNLRLRSRRQRSAAAIASASRLRFNAFIDAPPRLWNSRRCRTSSDAEILVQLRHVRVELGVRDHVDDPAVLHHVVPVGDGGREAEILLDQQDREALRLQLADRARRSAGRSPAPGLRWARRAAAGARRCAGCARSRASAARRPTASCPGSCGRSLQVRKQLVDLLDRQPAVAHLRRQHRFSSTFRLAKMPRSSGHQAMPRRAMRFDGRRTVSCRSKTIEPSRRGTTPMIDFSVVVLPAPLRPSSVTTSPARDVERDAVQDVRLAVPRVAGRAPRAAAPPPALAAALGSARQAWPAPRYACDDVGVLRHRRVVALRQHLAAREHGDVIGQRRHDRQVVLDHQHRPVGRHLLDQRCDPLDVLVRHAGRRLVEQHHLRLERQRRRDLERALAPVRQLAGGRAARIRARPTASISSRARASMLVQHALASARNRTSGRACAASAMRTFSSTVRCGKYRGDLERAHEAHPRDGRRSRAR